MNSALHFLHIYCLDFHLKKKSYLQTLRRFYGGTSFSRYPLVEMIFYENQDSICFLWDLGLWILTIQPSHSYTLAYCRSIHLIFIEFQNIDNFMQGTLVHFVSKKKKTKKHWQWLGLPTKKAFSFPSIVIILQSMRSLWLRFFYKLLV
jgi:hypothetical protein